SVTRYDDIFAVELDHENYSSSSELGGIQVADQPKGREISNFIRMDPPGHTAQRRTVAPIVAPSNLANFEQLIRKRTSDVLDALPRNETFDWAERVSTDLTNMMLATLFDFPWEDRMKLSWWSDVAIANVASPDAEPRFRNHPLSHAGAAYAPHRAPRHRTRRPPHRQGRQGGDVVHLRQPRRNQDRSRG